jgi:hypothetical protein
MSVYLDTISWVVVGNYDEIIRAIDISTPSVRRQSVQNRRSDLTTFPKQTITELKQGAG